MSEDVQTAEGREESKHHFFYFLQIAYCHVYRLLPAHIQKFLEHLGIADK
jgi:hypothetical protein